MAFNGFIKLHRKLMHWEWYQDSVVKAVFLHLLLTASFKEGSWRGVKVHCGQAIVGSQRLASELGLSRQQVRTALKKLTATGEITTRATNKYTVVTITNWAVYQSEDGGSRGEAVFLGGEAPGGGLGGAPEARASVGSGVAGGVGGCGAGSMAGVAGGVSGDGVGGNAGGAGEVSYNGMGGVAGGIGSYGSGAGGISGWDEVVGNAGGAGEIGNRGMGGVAGEMSGAKDGFVGGMAGVAGGVGGYGAGSMAGVAGGVSGDGVGGNAGGAGEVSYNGKVGVAGGFSAGSGSAGGISGCGEVGGGAGAGGFAVGETGSCSGEEKKKNHQLPASRQPAISQLVASNPPHLKKEEKEKNVQNKRRYGELQNVFLTQEEHLRLEEKIGPEEARRYIDRLSLYMGSTNKRYQNHYATVLSWKKKDDEAGGQKKKQSWNPFLELLMEEEEKA